MARFEAIISAKPHNCVLCGRSICQTGSRPVLLEVETDDIGIAWAYGGDVDLHFHYDCLDKSLQNILGYDEMRKKLEGRL